MYDNGRWKGEETALVYVLTVSLLNEKELRV
jgi:hypothetical protein